MPVAPLILSGATALIFLVYLSYTFNQGTGACCTGLACETRNEAQCDLIGGSFLADTSCAAAPCTLPPTPTPTPAPPFVSPCDVRFLYLNPRSLFRFCSADPITRFQYQIVLFDRFPEDTNCPKPDVNVTLSLICDGTPCKDVPGAIESVEPASTGDISCEEASGEILCPNIVFSAPELFGSSTNRIFLNGGFQNNVTILVTLDFANGESYSRMPPQTVGSVCP
jgi:hypothetical protein